MFTIQQIKEAHSKVKSGADFPKHTSKATEIIRHSGRIVQKNGVAKWIVLMDEKTCGYYDKAGNEVLVETIPI